MWLVELTEGLEQNGVTTTAGGGYRIIKVKF